jgi:hypothetical protein
MFSCVDINVHSELVARMGDIVEMEFYFTSLCNQYLTFLIHVTGTAVKVDLCESY